MADRLPVARSRRRRPRTDPEAQVDVPVPHRVPLSRTAGLHSRHMDDPGSEPTSSRFDELHAEATEAVSYAANSLRSVRDRYRAAHFEALGRWQVMADDLLVLERADATGTDGVGPRATGGSAAGASAAVAAAAAAEAGAADLRLKLLRSETDRARASMGAHESELTRLELAVRNLESTWLFLERGDRTLVADSTAPAMPTEIQMRILEAQEAERGRLAQEIHDGPAQALSNAIFQVEYIDRVLEREPSLVRPELGFLRELLRRELGDVRSFISQLRPSVLVELGLDGAIRDVVETQAALSGLAIGTDLAAPADGLTETAQTVVLRIAQEALQNVRKHADATSVEVTTRLEEPDWVLEVRDDGHGFDTGAVAARGRRNFGLGFMRERAELIGARFEVHSRPEAGTVVRLAVPLTRKENG